MASLNTSTNGPSIKSSYAGVINSAAPSGPAAASPTYGQWAVFSVSAPLVNAFQQDNGGKESILKVQSTGEGELVDLIEDFSEGRVQFAFVKVKDPNTTLPKYVLIGWCGEGVPERTKGYFTSHLAAVSKILHGYHVQITARSDRDLTPEGIVQKVADASGAKYSSSSAAPTPSAGPAPPLASKPVFNPTRSGAGGFNPLAGSRSRTQQGGNVDADGWGADAPPIIRSQLEKVAPAYKPTKVNMAELTKQKPVPTPFTTANRGESSNPDLVRGGYQPVGKVDIAAIRAQAQKKDDDRPTIVKGAYEPIGKVDIAAIRAKAQKPGDDGNARLSPAVTGTSNTSDSEQPKSLADRSAAFSQSERLTTLPRPKVANKFGSSASNFSGTKAPTPGQFGLHSAGPTTSAPTVGAASKTFADEGGKTPAQIWAEKKARERGLSGAADTQPVAAPIASQTSGSGQWKSGYAGKSWAPVAINATGRSGAGSIDEQRTGEDTREPEREEAPSSPAGGVNALKDRFKGGVPMGAPPVHQAPREDSPPPPPIPSATRPGPPGSLPSRSRADEDEEEEQSGPNIPPPPRVQRSPTPPTPEAREQSPVRIAIPVSRNAQPAAIEPPQERKLPPVFPTQSIERNIAQDREQDKEPAGNNMARTAGATVAGVAAGAAVGGAIAAVTTIDQGNATSGKRALISYDYEKAEDNELELVEGEYVTNIEMVDEDWWMGTNSRGESGLFPSNYVELVEGEEEQEEEEEQQPAPPQLNTATRPTPAPAAAPAQPAAPTATAIYDYEAAEDNELSFEENATITGLEFPDDDWWFGHFGGKSGLFPANYVQLDE